MLSRLTATSGGSGDSSRTITQELFDQSRRGHAREKHRHKSRKPRRTREVDMQSSMGTCNSGDNASKDVDVFEYLDQNTPDLSAASSRVRPRRLDLARRLSVCNQEESDKESIAQSQFSDSGISMSDSISASHSLLSQKTMLQPLPEYHIAPSTEQYPYAGQAYAFSPQFSSWTGVQGPHYPNHTVIHHSLRPTTDPNPAQRDHCQSMSPSHQGAGSAGPPSTPPADERHVPPPSGYELLSSRLSQPTDEDSKETLPPLYRKFRRLNHRILLQLQDEIAEMESHLELLDQDDTRLRGQPSPDEKPRPASRRMSWTWPESDLQARRLDLLGKIYIKLEQYNQAITTAQQVRGSTSKPRPEEVEHYRDWLDKNRPLTNQEMEFLDDDSDLFSLRAEAPPTITEPIEQQESSDLGLAISLITLVALLLFKLTLDLVFRAIILALTICAAELWKWQRAPHSTCFHHHDIYIALLAFVALLF